MASRPCAFGCIVTTTVSSRVLRQSEVDHLRLVIEPANRDDDFSGVERAHPKEAGAVGAGPGVK